MSVQTQKNHRIVIRAQSVQIISVIIFMMGPYSFQFIIEMLELQHGSVVALISHFFPTFHLFFEILALFYFIKPFRTYLIQWCKNILLLINV